MDKKSVSVYRWTYGLVALFVTHLGHAMVPDFNITPITSTEMLLPKNSAVMIRYKVTNQTQLRRQLTMQTILGVHQATDGAGICSNPFILNPNESCTLKLRIIGSQIPPRITGGPVICKTKSATDNTPDPFLCSQPAVPDRLAISLIPPLPQQKAYITNWYGNSISLCKVNVLDGSLIDCTVTAQGTPVFQNPEAIALNPSGSLLYNANIGGSSVSFCKINSATGALRDCQLTGGTFKGADGIAINPAGTLAYVSNASGNNVSVCQVDDTSGALGNCTATGANFHTPSDMTLDSAGLNAYVSNLISSSVSICPIDASGLLHCDKSTHGFNKPEGVTLHPSGQFAYITNNGSNNVSVCQVSAVDGSLRSCKITDGAFNGFGNLAFNSLGTQAYIPNMLKSTVSVCSVNLRNGDLYDCVDSHGHGFKGPSGILLK